MMMMAEAPMSVAVVQAAWPTAALMFRRLLSVPEWWTRLSKAGVSVLGNRSHGLQRLDGYLRNAV